MYLFILKGGRWRMGPYPNSGGISSRDVNKNLPTDVTGWDVWNGNSWVYDSRARAVRVSRRSLDLSRALNSTVTGPNDNTEEEDTNTL